jgi:hypothetical protein
MAKLPPHMQHAIKKPEREMNDADKLAYATKLALDLRIELLEGGLPGPKDMRPEATRHRALINNIAETTINQKIKVDETQLRERSSDQLPALLARIEAALKKPE